MDRHDLAASIRSAWTFLEASGLAESFAVADPLPVDPGFRDLILSPDSGHQEIYSYALRNSFYNFLLFDHAFFQFSWKAENDFRFAYYPNPHVSKPDALYKFRKYRQMVLDEKIDEEEFANLVQKMRFDGGVPVFRYEYSENQYDELRHPCSHLHIGIHGENRWAVSRVLTPLAFVKLMVKHYYPAEWAQGVSEVGRVDVHHFEEALIDEKNRCQEVGDEHFSSAERRSFHFG